MPARLSQPLNAWLPPPPRPRAAQATKDKTGETWEAAQSLFTRNFGLGRGSWHAAMTRAWEEWQATKDKTGETWDHAKREAYNTWRAAQGDGGSAVGAAAQGTKDTVAGVRRGGMAWFLFVAVMFCGSSSIICCGSCCCSFFYF